MWTPDWGPTGSRPGRMKMATCIQCCTMQGNTNRRSLETSDMLASGGAAIQPHNLRVTTQFDSRRFPQCRSSDVIFTLTLPGPPELSLYSLSSLLTSGCQYYDTT